MGHFSKNICLIQNHLQVFDRSYPLDKIFWAIFPVAKNPVVRRGQHPKQPSERQQRPTKVAILSSRR